MESLRGTGQAPLNLFHPSTIPSTSGSLEVAEQMVEGKGNQTQAVAVPNVVRSGYKHYRNGNEPGTSMFITSTIIDFVMVFAEHQNADLMAASLLSDLRHYKAELYAFVVMGHHIHLLVVPHEDMTASILMERIKANSARRIAPHLSSGLINQLSVQTGLNRRSLWKRSFRGVPIINSKMFRQKIRYIHMNPVRAGLCDRPEDYRWSSCWMYAEGKFDWQGGINIDDDLIRSFCDPELIKLGMKKRLAVVSYGGQPPTLHHWVRGE
jgi:putative transposase